METELIKDEVMPRDPGMADFHRDQGEAGDAERQDLIPWHYQTGCLTRRVSTMTSV